MDKEYKVITSNTPMFGNPAKLKQVLAEEALRAGAFGFTTSRTESHRTTRGEQVPGRYAAKDELKGIGAALGSVGRGVFGMLSDFEDEAAEFGWIEQQTRHRAK